jgi:hypothetical protein
MKTLTSILGAGVLALPLLLSTTSAHAVLINAKGTGINYTLTETDTASPLTDHFVLTITGINAATDTEGGREVVNAIAFNPPTGFTTAVMTAPATGFVLKDGGLASTGCNLSGNFFCFDNTAVADAAGDPGLPILAAGSSLTFAFDITTATGNFAGYNPSFKIDWRGTANNYDLISLPIGITPGGGGQQCANPPCITSVIEPGSSLVGMLGGAGWISRRRRNT